MWCIVAIAHVVPHLVHVDTKTSFLRCHLSSKWKIAGSKYLRGSLPQRLGVSYQLGLGSARSGRGVLPRDLSCEYGEEDKAHLGDLEGEVRAVGEENGEENWEANECEGNNAAAAHLSFTSFIIIFC